MKIEWQYNYTSESLLIENRLKYEIALGKKSEDASESITGFIELRPNKDDDSKIKSSGVVGITIPFSIEEGTKISHNTIREFSQKMAFEYGDFKIDWSLLLCERIPENEEEKKLIGEETITILRLALVEAAEKNVFDPQSLNKLKNENYNPILLKLFNDAELQKDIAVRFLTRFKILEAEFIDNNSRVAAKKQLESANDLYQVYKSVAVPNRNNHFDFKGLVSEFVDARGKCAHLKSYKYGFLRNDIRLKELEELDLELRELCRELIKFSKSA